MWQLVRQAEEARKQRQIDKAVRNYSLVLDYDAKNVRAHSGLAFTYLDVDEHRLALKHIEIALDSGEKSMNKGRLFFGASVALLNLDNWEAALEYATRLADLPGEFSQIKYHSLAGRIYHDQGKYLEAADHLEERLRLATGRDTAKKLQRDRFQLAETYIELNRPEDALGLLKHVLSARFSRPVQDRIGRLQLQLGHFRDASISFAALLEQDPKDVRALCGQGLAALARHQYDDAIASFSEVLLLESNNLRALDGLTEAHKHKGELQTAAGYVEQARRHYNLPEAQTTRRLRRLDQERARRDAELLRIRNIASLNVMATGIAHELRQPLSVIRLATQNAQRDLAEGEMARITEDLAEIDSHVGRLDGVISVLRDMGNANDEKKVSSVVLEEVIDRAHGLFRHQLVSRNIQFETEGLEHPVLANRDGLVQVFVNLISNARDAIAERPTRTIKVWTVPGVETLSVYVRDQGAGMSADVRRQAFDPFYSTKNEGGVGVGLYIAYNLARQSGGRLLVKESRPGKGTTFELTLRIPKDTPCLKPLP